MHVIDTTVLLLLFQPAALVPHDEHGKAVSAPQQRVKHLVEQLQKEGARLIVPTPVMAEVLMKASSQQFLEIQQTLQENVVFRIEPFDSRAALELGIMNRQDSLQKKGRKLDPAATYAKLKFDRQIVAIAKVNGATTIYSDDGDLRTFAKKFGIEPIGLGQIPLPPKTAQHDLLEPGEA